MGQLLRGLAHLFKGGGERPEDNKQQRAAHALAEDRTPTSTALEIVGYGNCGVHTIEQPKDAGEELEEEYTRRPPTVDTAACTLRNMDTVQIEQAHEDSALVHFERHEEGCGPMGLITGCMARDTIRECTTRHHVACGSMPPSNLPEATRASAVDASSCSWDRVLGM